MNRTRAALLVVVAALTGLVVALPSGCTRVAPTGTKEASGGPGKAADPWPAAVAELRKEADPTTCRRVLNQLSADLTRDGATPPTPLSDSAAKVLAERLRLTGEELKEAVGSAYTGLDASYLFEAIYLRDVARALDVQGLPPDRQATAAFAWVCRQVYLRPWLVVQDGRMAYGPPMPALHILSRGYGTGIDRAYVLLALAQQLGLDGCLVGTPGQEKAAVQRVVDGKLAKGPFWAVGVRAGEDVLLFDPWRGEPLPGPGGKGVGTLGQLKKTPDQVKPWRDDKAAPWDVAAADVTGAVVYVTTPLSAVTPRMKLLDAQIGPGLGVKLAGDPAETAGRFGKAVGTVAVWAPPGEAEPFAYHRVMATVIPKADGGLNPNDLLLLPKLAASLVPPIDGTRPTGLTSDVAAGLIADRVRDGFHRMVVVPAFRERIHRGQFHDVSQDLVAAEKRFAAAEERGRTPVEADLIRGWVEKANAAYKGLTTARSAESDPDVPAETKFRMSGEARAAEADLWQGEIRGAAAVIEQGLAGPARAEVAFLFAVCKHEQAEKAHLRLARAEAGVAAAKGEGEKATAEGHRDQARHAAASAWAAAKDAWERYTPYSTKQAAAFPGRPEHAKRLADRATRQIASPTADE